MVCMNRRDQVGGLEPKLLLMYIFNFTVWFNCVWDTELLDQGLCSLMFCSRLCSAFWDSCAQLLLAGFPVICRSLHRRDSLVNSSFWSLCKIMKLASALLQLPKVKTFVRDTQLSHCFPAVEWMQIQCVGSVCINSSAAWNSSCFHDLQNKLVCLVLRASWKINQKMNSSQSLWCQVYENAFPLFFCSCCLAGRAYPLGDIPEDLVPLVKNQVSYLSEGNFLIWGL